jgi:MoaA/NifB/PqqE/SkfB family radical SAM enzyme
MTRVPSNKSLKDNTRVHYRHFHNIFLYITERCQLRCGHCYMGGRLERGMVLSYQEACRIIRSCRRLGAEYITLIGGEPTIHPDLPKIVAYACACGYKQVMIDTNGIRPDRIMIIPNNQLYSVTVSLDGATSGSHERVRGSGTFARTLGSIRKLVAHGYRVRINCTVFKFSIHEAVLVIKLAEELGVHLVNYHTFSEEGFGFGKSDWSLTPYEWITFCESLERIRKQSSVSVWYPPTWTTQQKLPRYVAEGFNGCLGCSLDRLSIFPDGRCYLCSVLFDRSMHFATITEDGFILNRNKNEFDAFSRAAYFSEHQTLTGCPAEKILEEQGKRINPSGFISLCRCWKSQT